MANNNATYIRDTYLSNLDTNNYNDADLTYVQTTTPAEQLAQNNRLDSVEAHVNDRYFFQFVDILTAESGLYGLTTHYPYLVRVLTDNFQNDGKQSLYFVASAVVYYHLSADAHFVHDYGTNET